MAAETATGGPLKLDWVSPLPPVRSGIADYSTDLLPHLAERADIRVLRLPDQPVAAEVEDRWHPVAAERAGEEGRLPVYQMGNNPYHSAVDALAMERPGVLTLHDLVLHHLLHHTTLGHSDFAAYRSRLAADHGWIGEATSHPRHWGIEDQASLFGLPVNRSLLRRQRGVLVHSRWARTTLLDDDPELAVREVPMAIPLPPPAERGAGLALRERWGIPAVAPLLGSFGFQTPIKRTDVAIVALADPRLAAVHLLVAGESSPALDLDAAARAAGVRERVHLTGFLPFEELTAAIAATDLCLNLRYPTAGETSASLLRVLAVGRPCLVSDHAQFAELPDEVVVKVPLAAARHEDEATALAAAVARVLAAPDRLARMGAAAREHVRRHHDPDAAAAAVVEACAAWRDRPPLVSGLQPAAMRPLPPPTSLVWPLLPARIDVTGSELPWRAGERRRLRIQLHNTGEARWLAAHHGPGGMALAVELTAERSVAPHLPWLPLQRDVEPGGKARFEVELRRPSGPVRLAVGPRVLAAPEAELARWEEEI